MTAQQIADDLNAWLIGKSISVKPPSFFDLARRWAKHNQRPLYLFFALFAAISFCALLLLGFLSGNVGNVYDKFPDEPRPLLFTFNSLPRWTNPVSSFFFIFIVWPSIGFLNTILTKPKSFWQSVGYGLATAAASSLLVYLLVGWLIVSIGVRNMSDYRIDILTQAIWPPEGVEPSDATSTADKMFVGLDSIPTDQRAAVVRDRIIADNFAVAPTSLSYAAGFCLLFSLPVLAGTVISFVLFQQGGRKWLIGIRYYAALAAIFVVGIFVYAFLQSLLFENTQFTANTTATLMITALAIIVAFLCLRNWRHPGAKPSSN